MKKVLYIVLQCTWGVIQSVLGLIVFLLYIKGEHFNYHGSLVTVWKNKSSLSLGMFVFVEEKPFFPDSSFPVNSNNKNSFKKLLVHEYGHTVQSLILGPLYLPIIGIPSFARAAVRTALTPLLRKKGKELKSYYSFYTEKTANVLGERVTGENQWIIS